MNQSNVAEVVELKVSKTGTVTVPLAIVEEAMMDSGANNVSEYLETLSYVDAQLIDIRYRRDLLTDAQHKAFVNAWVMNDIDLLFVEGELAMTRDVYQSLIEFASSYTSKTAITRDFGNDYDYIIYPEMEEN